MLYPYSCRGSSGLELEEEAVAARPSPGGPMLYPYSYCMGDTGLAGSGVEVEVAVAAGL